MQQQQDFFFQMMKASLEGAERLQKHQLEGMREAVDYWSRVWRVAGETQAAYTPPQAANAVMNQDRKERKSA